MATLRSTTNFFARGTSSFEITPNPPHERTLIDTYQVRLWTLDTLVYEQTQSVRDWQMRHFYVQEIARACCSASLLIGQTLTAPELTLGTTQLSFLSLTHAVMSTDWLTISLAGANTKKRGPLIHIDVYAVVEEITLGDIQKRSTGAWSRYQSIKSIQLTCTPEDTFVFGQTLLAEIEEVEQQRVALRIPKYDNPAYGELDEEE